MVERGVRSSCVTEEKKSDFILSNSLSLLHMRLNEPASADNSGGEEMARSSLKCPFPMSLVFFSRIDRGWVMLLLIHKEVTIPNMRKAPVIMTATRRNR